MSDNWIVLIPENPRHVPEKERQDFARIRFQEICPDAVIEVKVFEEIQFFDCGSNFERIVCPVCASEISMDWWQDLMDKEFDALCPLEKKPTPCCGAMHTLHELRYDWPQGFGRFSLEAMNPNTGLLEDGDKAELEKILGCSLRVIYSHY